MMLLRFPCHISYRLLASDSLRILAVAYNRRRPESGLAGHRALTTASRRRHTAAPGRPALGAEREVHLPPMDNGHSIPEMMLDSGVPYKNSCLVVLYGSDPSHTSAGSAIWWDAGKSPREGCYAAKRRIL